MFYDILEDALVWWPYLAAGAVFLVFSSRLRPNSCYSSKIPRKAAGHLPVIGAFSFWSQRWTFFQQAISMSSTGNFSFWAGSYHVVGLSGDVSRHAFYHSKQLGLAEGYAILGGKMPSTHVEGEQGEDIWPKQEFLTYMKERVRRMLQRGALEKRLPLLIEDTKSRLDEVGPVFNPFDSIYRLIFLLILRSIGCYDICEDRAVLDDLINCYNKFSSCATISVIIFPWLPTPNLLARYYYGARLFLKFQSVVEKRQKLTSRGVRLHDDPLQELVDHQCGTSHIVGILLGAVFAGQQNTSVNAGWILVHLVHDKAWADKIREEIARVATKYDADESRPLRERLSSIPLAAWENDFPTIDLCVKENLRLHGLGSQMRQNTGPEMTLPSGEVIPFHSFASYHTADIHLNPSLYPDPLNWNPARYLPDRAEDSRKPLAWVGWGAGRHFCLGMKLAQLELHILVAMFFATFEDAHLCDAEGGLRSELPPIDFESWISDRPKNGDAFIKIKRKPELDRI